MDDTQASQFETEREILAGSGLFDVKFYLSANPDVAQSKSDPLQHYLGTGARQGRKPNALFDPAYYVANTPEASTSTHIPLIHYILHGENAGARPSLLFEPSWYRERYNIDKSQSALAHYLLNKRGFFSPIPEFDSDFYLKNYPDIAEAGIDPFNHYLVQGYKEGRKPSEHFDTRFYTQRYLKGQTEQNPLVHYRGHMHLGGYHVSPQNDEATIPGEVKRFSKPGRHFEDVLPLSQTVQRRAKVLAYYLPQFHPIEENDRWWGNGFTEWSNIARGLPRFQDHYQPRIPRDLGFYSLENLETLRRQVLMAKGGGIHGFVFYYYWFNRRRLLERPVEAFLANPDIDMPFCLMWANENWTRRWDGMESEVLIAQDYRNDDNDALIDDYARHFADPRYIRIDGRPLLMVYRASLIPNTAETVQAWRKLFMSRHNENPLLVMAQSFEDIDPRTLGFDGAVEFPPHKLTGGLQRINDQVTVLDHTFSANVYDYDALVARSLGEPSPPFPLIKTAVPGWDNDARRQGAGLVVANSTPSKYETWLSQLVDRAQKHRFFNEPLVCINAWNEWCEGAYLEPDQHFGSAYLNATARAVAGFVAHGGGKIRLLLVGHDAFPSGAQHLLLNIGKVLRDKFGFGIEFLLLDGGAMEDDYRAVAPVTISSGRQDLAEKLLRLRERGFHAALCNTCACGAAAAALRSLGMRSVMLVHELPRIVRDKKLEHPASNGIVNADIVIFPNAYVQDKLLSALALKTAANQRLVPQGLYNDFQRDDVAASAFRQSLGIKPGEKLVIGVGYADFRKGFDLFYQAWRVLETYNAGMHFAWIGDMDPQIREWMEREVAVAGMTGRFHLCGYQKDIAGIFSAADGFLLSSREDPFPTVVLEAMSAGVPVFAFDETGGAAHFLRHRQLGHVAPYCDVSGMAALISRALAAPPDHAMIERAKEVIDGEFRFADYVSTLVQELVPALPTVSVIVPNYNYARYLPDRLHSIFDQTHPLRELLVLDDASSDNSVQVVMDTAEAGRRDVELVLNEENSGSAFAQWTLGATIASGEYVWIAEADDAADPGFLSALLPLMQADPAIAFCFSDSRAIDGEGELVYENYKSYYATLEPDALTATGVFSGPDFVRRYLGIKNVILNASGVLWRREALLAAIERCGADLVNYKVAGDWRIYLEALSAPGASVGYVAEPHNVHRRHSVSLTHGLETVRHTLEIQRCQNHASLSFSLDDTDRERQAAYFEEVRQQLNPR